MSFRLLQIKLFLKRVVIPSTHTFRFSGIFIQGMMLACLALFFSSCAPPPPGVVQPPDSAYVTASWYGPKFHGRPTASGEKFNMFAMTCAHKLFTFGTRLRVTNVKNNKSVIVTVNDRGPFISGRDLDLSYAAAREIGLIKQGVGKVRIQYIGRDNRYVQRIGSFASVPLGGPFTIQVGSFKKESNAKRLRKGLKIKYKNVYITTAYLDGQKFYRVRIGTFKDRQRAYLRAKTLAEEGYSIFITNQP
jgi:rare lipoprotein A